MRLVRFQCRPPIKETEVRYSLKWVVFIFIIGGLLLVLDGAVGQPAEPSGISWRVLDTKIECKTTGFGAYLKVEDIDTYDANYIRKPWTDTYISEEHKKVLAFISTGKLYCSFKEEFIPYDYNTSPTRFGYAVTDSVAHIQPYFECGGEYYKTPGRVAKGVFRNNFRELVLNGVVFTKTIQSEVNVFEKGPGSVR